MESHIGADLLHELMPSTFKADLEELVPSPSPPCLLTAIGAGKNAPYGSNKIKVEETGSSPSTASELRLVEDTPTCSSLSDSPRRWREMSPMKVPIPESYRKELLSSNWPLRVEPSRGQDATREPLPTLAAWAQAEARAGRFTCLSTTPELTRPSPPAYPPPAWPCPFEAPPALPIPPLPPQSADGDFTPLSASDVRRRASTSGKTGNFMCKFVFNGFDAKNHADFELVPRLIGRKGCNLRPISQSCRGKIRVTGWDGSQPMGKFQTTGKPNVDSPVEVTLSCHDQESLDEGIRQINILLEDLSNHFSRYCYKRGISPVPELYHLLL